MYSGQQYSYQKTRTEYKGPKEAAILRSSKEGWLNVSTPYLKACVNDIKAYIEPSGRAWNPDTKYWEIKEIYLGTLVTILKKHFGEDNIIQNLTEEENLSSNVFKPVFNVLKGMPDGNMDKVYSALAFAVHPDRGGSDDQMKALNEAYQQAKQK